MSGAAHNDTVNFLIDELQELGDYYRAERQPWSSLVQMNGTASFFADGVYYQPGLMEYSPSVNTTAPIVVVKPESHYPAEVEGNIALISRDTCEFGLKSVLAGLVGAAGAVIYNNIPGALNGTLDLPREEGPYVPTVAISQENGTALIDTITSGTAVTGIIDVFTIIGNRTTFNVIATTNCGSPIPRLSSAGTPTPSPPVLASTTTAPVASKSLKSPNSSRNTASTTRSASAGGAARKKVCWLHVLCRVALYQRALQHPRQPQFRHDRLAQLHLCNLRWRRLRFQHDRAGRLRGNRALLRSLVCG